MTKSIEELIASIPLSGGGVSCWAEPLTGRAAEFVAGVKASEEKGVKLNRGAILDILKREFNVSVGEDTMRKHLLSRCRCGT